MCVFKISDVQRILKVQMNIKRLEIFFRTYWFKGFQVKNPSSSKFSSSCASSLFSKIEIYSKDWKLINRGTVQEFIFVLCNNIRSLGKKCFIFKSRREKNKKSKNIVVQKLAHFTWLNIILFHIFTIHIFHLIKCQ